MRVIHKVASSATQKAAINIGLRFGYKSSRFCVSYVFLVENNLDKLKL